MSVTTDMHDYYNDRIDVKQDVRKNALAISKNALAKDVLQLKESMEILHDLIKEQGEELNTIEDEIHINKQLIIQGTDIISSETNYVTNYATNYATSIIAGIGGIILVLCMLL